MIHEFIADKKAVEDSDTSAFAAMILQAAYPKHRFELTNNFFYSPIKRRLMMLTKNKNPRVNYIGRIMVLPLAVLVFAAFSLKAKTQNKPQSKIGTQITELPVKHIAQTTTPEINSPAVHFVIDTVPAKIITDVKPVDTELLYIMNGKETPKDIVEGIKPENIQDIRIVKEPVATKVYGEKGKNGVIIVNTKPWFNVTKEKWTADAVKVIGNNTEKSFGANPLMVVDNKEYPGKTLDEVSDLIGETSFAAVEIYTNEEAVKFFGERAKDGAVVASTKHSNFIVVEGKPMNEAKYKQESSNYSLAKQDMLQEQQRLGQLNYVEKKNALSGCCK